MVFAPVFAPITVCRSPDGRSFWERGSPKLLEVLTDDELKAMIDEIERKDRVVIKDKGVILTGSGDN